MGALLSLFLSFSYCFVCLCSMMRFQFSCLDSGILLVFSNQLFTQHPYPQLETSDLKSDFFQNKNMFFYIMFIYCTYFFGSHFWGLPTNKGMFGMLKQVPENSSHASMTHLHYNSYSCISNVLNHFFIFCEFWKWVNIFGKFAKWGSQGMNTVFNQIEEVGGVWCVVCPHRS